MSSMLAVRSNGRSVYPDRTPETVLSTQRPAPDFNSMLSRVRREFVEMPGLSLTEPQARRLWSLDRQTCAALLAVLVNARVLMWTSDGRVMKTDRGPDG